MFFITFAFIIMIQMILFLTYFSIFISAEYYSEKNSSAAFYSFKEKYQKTYFNKTIENNAYKNFVRNLNKAEVLNTQSKDPSVIIYLNKYADIDTDEFEEHFAVNISAFETHEIYKGPFVRDSKLLRTHTGGQLNLKNVDDLDFYDLDSAESIYNQYLSTFNKNSSADEYTRTVRYLKFVKTLAGINKARYNGLDKLVDENADELEHANEYTY